MANVTFDTYLDHLLGGSFVWTTTPVQAAVFFKDAWTPSKGDVFLLDAITAGALELDVEGAPEYARTTLPSPTQSIDGGGHRGLLNGALVDFGAISAGYNFDTLVLFVLVSDDSDSWMLTAFDVGAQVTDGTTLRFAPNVDGFYEVVAP